MLTPKYFRSDHNSMCGPKFSENNGLADQFSRNFGPPDQNFRRTKISVTPHVHMTLYGCTVGTRLGYIIMGIEYLQAFSSICRWCCVKSEVFTTQVFLGSYLSSTWYIQSEKCTSLFNTGHTTCVNCLKKACPEIVWTFQEHFIVLLDGCF